MKPRGRAILPHGHGTGAVSRGPGVVRLAREGYDSGRGGRGPASREVEMTHAPKISRAQAIALPRTAPTPAPAAEWIAAGIAVVLLIVGLFS